MVDRVHIGAHKTGSTAVQGSLVYTTEALLARGILYPEAGRVGPGHARLAAEVAFREAPVTEAQSHGELLSEWRAVCARALLLFSEYLTPAESYWPVDWPPRLLEELRPRRVQVIGYVRPPWEQIEAV